MLPTYIHLLASAIFPIYIVSHASLNRQPCASKPAKKRTRDAEKSEDEGEAEADHKIESLTPTDAIIFPLLAGGTLASLYFILKWLQDPAWVS
jgi:minor histocompatibility antigen H13